MSKNQLLKKKMEAGAAKPSTNALFNEDSSKNKEKDKKIEGWSDEEDDYKIDVQVNEKKGTEGSKPVLVNAGAGWKDVDLKIEPQAEAPKTNSKKWGDGLKVTNDKVDDEAFPSIGEEKKSDKKSQPQVVLGRGSQPAASLFGAEPEGDGRIKLKNSKGIVNNVLMGKPLATATPAPAEAPVQAPVLTQKPAPTGPTSSLLSALNEDSGSQVIKLKGKLKVEYKETSAEKRQREAEQEIIKKELEKRNAEKEKAAAHADKKRTFDGKPGEHKPFHKDEHKEHHHKGFGGDQHQGEHKAGLEGKGSINPVGEGKMGRGHIQTPKEKAEQQAQLDGWMKV